MNILITGAKGFLGKNLNEELYNIKDGKDNSFSVDNNIEIMEYNSETTEEKLIKYCQRADVVFHFAAINRTTDVEDFQRINVGFTKRLIDCIEHYGHVSKVVFASSTQATLEGRFVGSPYGKSKKEAEKLLCEFAERTKTEVLIYRFPGIFGKWCKPNYNSVVATFCHNISRGIPIQINDASTVIELVYIDDVLNEMITLLTGNEKEVPDYVRGNKWKYCYVPTSYNITVGELADLLYEFKEMRNTLAVPDMKNSLIRKMWATYLSYLPENGFTYPLKMNVDHRGSFTEIIKTLDRGQISVNISKPGIIKGQHWHHSKNEKFVVVSGKAVLQFRKIGIDEQGKNFPIIEYHVSGEKIEVVDIPTGYTHNIINVGEEDLVTLIWASEIFDPDKPDTFFEEV